MRLRSILFVAAMLMVTVAAQADVSTSYNLSTNPVATLSGTQSLDSLTLSGSGTLTINGSSSPTVNYGDYTYLSVGVGQSINNTGNVAWNVTTGDTLWNTGDAYFRIIGGSWKGASTVNAGGGVLYFDAAYSSGAYVGATVTGTHTFNAAYVFIDGTNTSLTGTYNINIDTSYGNGDEGFYISDEGSWFGSASSSTTFASTGGTIDGNVYVGRGAFLGSGTHITGDVWMGSGKFMGNHTIDGSLNVRTYPGMTQAPVNQVGYMWWYPTGPAIVSPSSTPGTRGTMTVGGNATLDSNTTLQFQLGSNGVSDLMAVTGAVNLGQDTHTPVTLNIVPMTGFYIAPNGSSLNYTLLTGSSITGTVALGAADLAGKVYSYTPTYTSNSLGVTVSRLSGSTLWLGGSGTNFSTLGNWDNGVPVGGINAGVDLGGANTITMNTAGTFASLSVGGAGNWTINGSGALNATQLFYASLGTSTISAPLTADVTVSAGSLTVSNLLSGNLNVSGGALTVNGSSAGTGNVSVTGTGSMFLSAPLSGAASITVNSSASGQAMTMTGQQNYSGTTTFNQGYSTIIGNPGDTSDVGAGNLILNSGQYLYLTNATIGAGNTGARMIVTYGNVTASGTINRSVEWYHAPYLCPASGGLTINHSPDTTTALTVIPNGQLFVSGGSNLLTINGDVVVQAGGQFSVMSPVTVNGSFSSLSSNSISISSSTSLTVTGLTTANISGGGTLNASGGLILASANINFDPNAFQNNGWPNNNPGTPKGTVTTPFNVAGTFGIQNGWMTLTNESQIPSAVTNLALGGQGSTGGIWVDNESPGSSSSPITQSITLSGEGGVLTANSWTGCGWTGCGAANTPFDGVISGTGNLFILAGYAQTFEGTTNNTYTGNTYVLGWANVLTSARALNGNVTVAPGENLTLTSAANLDSTKTVNVSSIQFASPQMNFMGQVGVLGDFVPNISSSSSGALTLESNLPNQNYSSGLTGAAVNAALAVGSAPLGNGYMYLSGPNVQGGQNWGEVFTGSSLQPDVDNVYRFWLNNSGFTLANNNDWCGPSGVLADVNGTPESVLISTGPNWGNEWLSTNDANNFSGSLTVNANSFFGGWVLSSGSPFGAATGNVYLNGGGLGLNSWNTAPAVVAKNNLYLQGQNVLSFNPQDSNQKILMSFNSINRVNNGILGIYVNSWGTLGGTVKLTVTTPPANTNGMVAPWIVDYYGASFMQYNSTTGFAPAAFTATDSFGANNGTDIVNLTNTTGTTIPSGTNVYALRTAGALTGGDVTIGSGGLILAGAPVSNPGTWGGPQAGSNNVNITLVSTANINFGSAEGVIYSTGHDPSKNDGWYTGWNELAGTISGTGGLTIGSPLNGNGTPYIFISGNNTNLSGQVTIDQSIVKICNTTTPGGAGNNTGISYALGTGTIFLNGGTGNNGNCAMGALSPFYNTGQDGLGNVTGATGNAAYQNGTSGASLWNGTTVTLNNPIVIGPNGGTFLLENWSNFQLNGQVSGTGTMGVTGGGWVILNNTSTSTPNNWTGGTYINGGLLQVNSGSKIGPGPVLITGSGALVLYSATGTNNTNDISMYNTWSYGDSGLTAYSQVGNPGNTNDPLYGTMDNQLAVGASATIGTLSGTGNVMLGYNVGYQSQPVTLTFGNTESSDFYGMFENYQQASWSNNYTTGGNIVYAGTGDFTFWGQDMRLASSWGTYFSATTTIQSGTFTNNGTLAGTGVTVTGGTLNGSGAIKAPVTVNSGGTLAGALTVIGNVTSTGAINAGGVINGNLAANAGTVAGTTAVNGNFTVGIVGGTSATVTGTHAISGNVALTNGSFTAGIGTTIGSLNVAAAGAFAGSSAIAGAVTNAGTIDGEHMIGGNYTQNAGSFSGMSTFGTTAAPVAVTVNAGSFSGNHTINGSFATTAGSNVVLATHNGSTAGTLAIVGTTTLDHSTVLNFNLGPAGTTGGNVNDLIDVTGNLSLDGTLNVTNLSGFATGTYAIIDYTGALTGAGLTLGTTPTGYNYKIVTTTPNEIELSVTPFLIPGDTNGDGVVNSLDIDAIYRHLTVLPPGFTGWNGVGGDQPWPWAQSAYQAQCDVNGDQAVSQDDVTYELRNYFLTSYGDADLNRATDFQDFQALLDHWQNSGAGIGWAEADFNGDGVVDFLDFQNLLDYWNPSGWNFAPTQTPEPASLSLILLGGLALLRRSRK